MKYLAFDIETARLAPNGENLLLHRPLGISCYALAWQEPDGVKTLVGYGKDEVGQPGPQMTQAECQTLVLQLTEYVKQGFTLLTWNGLGFDFDILAEESGMYAQCVELACAHVDMLFHFFCLQGYPLGLNAAAKGMGLAGKPEGMDGSQAPMRWQQGEYQTVLEYVAQDVITTLDLAAAVEDRGQIRWKTRAGKPNRVALRQWMRVTEALELPLPDTKWIRNPMTRGRFTDWMEKQA
jgi:hypothetical protein